MIPAWDSIEPAVAHWIQTLLLRITTAHSPLRSHIDKLILQLSNVTKESLLTIIQSAYTSRGGHGNENSIILRDFHLFVKASNLDLLVRVIALHL